MDTVFIQAAQLGGTVFTTVAFLWYLLKTTDKQIESQVALAKALQRLSDIVERNTEENSRGSVNRSENTVAVKENTGVIDKNTEVVSNTNK